MYTIVCLGDSITCEWEEPHYPTFWQELVDQKYGQGKVKIIAAGVNGETAQDGYYRLSSDVISHHPNLVTIMFGHNDIHQGISVATFRQSLLQIIASLKSTPIWLLSPNQISNPQMVIIYQPYLTELKSLAAAKHLPYIDLWSAFDGQDLSQIYTYPNDYVHPNALGHRLLAKYLLQQFEKFNLLSE